MGKLTPILLLTGSVLTPVLAAKDTSPAPAPKDAAAPAAGQADDQADARASRYQLAAPEKAAQETWAKLVMRSRNIDPFGLPQDPSLAPPKPTPSQKTKKLQNFAPTPFSEVVAAIRVNGVTKGSFLVRDRTFKTGDTFPIRYLDKLVQVRVLKVTTSAIHLQNLQTGESASLALNILPPGIQRGKGTTGPPGIQRDNPSTPLVVDIPQPSTAATER